jgi:hypothetical protein
VFGVRIHLSNVGMSDYADLYRLKQQQASIVVLALFCQILQRVLITRDNTGSEWRSLFNSLTSLPGKHELFLQFRHLHLQSWPTGILPVPCYFFGSVFWDLKCSVRALYLRICIRNSNCQRRMYRSSKKRILVSTMLHSRNEVAEPNPPRYTQTTEFEPRPKMLSHIPTNLQNRDCVPVG